MYQSIADCLIHLLARPSYVLLHLLKLVLPAEEDVAVVLAAVQMLHQLRHNLTLLAAVLPFHSSVHESGQQFVQFKVCGKPPENVLVEVVDEIVEVFFVGLWSKTLSSNPLNLVPFLMVGVVQ